MESATYGFLFTRLVATATGGQRTYVQT